MKAQFVTDYPAVAPLFSPGQKVKVRATAPLGHIRTPFYIRGHVGEVERLCADARLAGELFGWEPEEAMDLIRADGHYAHLFAKQAWELGG